LKDPVVAKNNDPLIESLMQLAVSAAPLIRKAREAGIFRERETVVEAEVVTPAAKPEPAPAPPEPPRAPEPAPAAVDTGQTAALQDIVVRQALRINELEAEVAAVKAAMAALAAATAAPAPTKPRPKASPKAKPAKA
jgi:hypothetical protein